jgi:hypothetical protein
MSSVRSAFVVLFSGVISACGASTSDATTPPGSTQEQPKPPDSVPSQTPPEKPTETPAGKGPGSLDTAFAKDLAFETVPEDVDIATLSDNSFFLALRDAAGTLTLVLKLSATGSLDKSFGFGGALPMPPPNNTTWGSSCAIASHDGKVCALGSASLPSNSTMPRELRFTCGTADGKQDKTFGTQGVSTFALEGVTTFRGGRLASDKHGFLHFAGEAELSNKYSDVIVGVMGPDGGGATIQHRFPGTPQEERTAPGAVVSANASVVLSVDSNTWVGGSAFVLSGTKLIPRPLLHVVQADGTAKAVALGDNGYVRALWRVKNDTLAAVGVLDDVPTLIHATPNGSLDTAFGNNGKMQIPTPCTTNKTRIFDAVASEQGDHYMLFDCGAGPFLLHTMADGKPDANFGKAGVTSVPVAGATRLGIHSGGVIVAGRSGIARVLR